MSPPAVVPDACPLPPPPSDPLTKDQWDTLLAIGDTIIASLQPRTSSNADSTAVLPVSQDDYSAALASAKRYAAPDADPANFEAWLQERPSTNPAVKDALHRVLGQYTPADSVKQMGMVLSVLNYRVGTLVLGGYATRFADLPVASRHAILLSWQTSRIPQLRLLYKTLTLMFKQFSARSSPALYNIIGFPRVPVHGEPIPGFDFKFLQFPPATGVYVGKGNPPEPEEVLETDVVIVGSGCGGGVSAKNIAEMGLRVIVTEKMYHWPTKHMPMDENAGMTHMFMDGGSIIADDSDMVIIAGAAWGGGGTVNWSASLQTQGFVRKEWAEKDKLPFFTSAAFQTSLDRICERMGVSDKHIEHNHANRALMDGARKLGWAHKAVPQNTAGKQHYCGYCTLGCAACEKQGPANSFLPDAANAGATFIEGFDAREIVFEKALKNGKRIVSGVRGIWTSRDANGGVAGPRTTRKVFIKAKRVIVSCGTMQSPLLLLRSGLKNRNIGRHLKAHPVSLVAVVYDHETRPWEGGILTSVVTEFENLDGQGHGAKLETAVMLPSIFLAFPAWRDAVSWKAFAPKVRNAASMFSMARDIGEGYVYPDPVDGRTRFHYHTHPRDRAHVVEGLCQLVKLAYISGAREIIPAIPGLPPFVRDGPIPPSCTSSSFKNPYPAPRGAAPNLSDASSRDVAYPSGPSDLDDTGINDEKLNAYIARMRKLALPAPDSLFVSAHQMGTCRMGASPSVSVVDPRGQVWGTDGLYVADASVFPSASGVNPMVTNMAISDWISRGVGKGLGGVEPSRGVGVKL